MTGHEQGTVLTGGTGFLGGEVLARLLERDEAPVYVLVRAQDDEGANARLKALLESLLGSADPWSRRAIAVRGDVSRPWLGMSSRDRDWLAERADRIIHCAASVSFTGGLDEQRGVNVAGTRRMYRARRTLRASGRSGDVRSRVDGVRGRYPPGNLPRG